MFKILYNSIHIGHYNTNDTRAFRYTNILIFYSAPGRSSDVIGSALIHARPLHLRQTVLHSL